MLTRLTVRNLAIVEAADVAFGEGLNIITGETGAGKSVLMGALELVLGARADASTVRDGAKEARVEAEFALSDASVCAEVARVLDDAGLPPCEDGALVVRRTVSATGGGRVHVNDAASTVQTLRALGRLLVDVHGPNDHQSLLEESFQRRLLDAYGKIDAAPYSAAWRNLCDLRAELDALQGDAGDFAEECERLRYAVDELDAANLCEEDETELPARHAAAAHAAEILDCANAVTSALSGDDDASAANALAAAGMRLAEMAKYHEPAQEWREELESVAVRVQELARSVEDSVSRLDADPEALQALDDRLSLVQRLKRKYNCPTVSALLELRDARAARLADLEGRDGRIRELTDAVAAAEAAVAKAGAALGAARRKASERFAKAVTKELHGLGFLKAGFGVGLTARAPDASGCDAVEFRFEPNPGEPPRPLRDIASTGERAVGERLRAVSRHHQVIAITHLPQSAVWGDRHLAVAKTVSGGRTRTAIRVLEGDDRVAEIARMLGGASLTSVVAQHARELLALAASDSPKKK